MVNVEHPLYQADLNYTAEFIHKNQCFNGKKKILVIGATGLIGSFLTDVLLYYNSNIEEQFDVYAIGRSKQRLWERFSYAIPGGLHLWEHDIIQPLKTEIEFDYIFHLASNADPGTYASYPVETITTNVQGSINVLEYAKEYSQVSILFTSSIEVYGENGGEALQEGNYGLVDYNKIRAGYPESKRVAELLYKSAVRQYGIHGYIARLGYVYGPTMTDDDNKVVAQFIRAAVNGQNLVLTSSGQQRRSYCYVADAVTGIAKVLASGNVGEAYNVADRNSLVTIRQMGEIVARQAGVELVRENRMEENTAIDNREDRVLDCSKLEQLGWRTETRIEKGIGRTLKVLG